VNTFIELNFKFLEINIKDYRHAAQDFKMSDNLTPSLLVLVRF
jgi:hypothetical protein